MTRNSWKVVALVSIPWMTFMVIYRSMFGEGVTFSGVVSIIITGIIFGIAFALFTSYSAKRQYAKTIITIPHDEEILVEGGGAQKKGNAAIPGKLVLTANRLIFKSYNISASSEENFATERIASARIANDLFKKDFEIELVNGKVFTFTIDDPKLWVDYLLLKSNPDSHRGVNRKS
jgi:hypothetical protein